MNNDRRLLLVRHGLPDYRGGQAGDELPGPPLSEIGHQQAAQAADVVRTYSLEDIHVSPLARARQTAEHIAAPLGLAARVSGDLREWHRTERLHDVSVRMTRWLVNWLRGPQRCAVLVSHASPLLAILRSALFLPHVGWYQTGHPERLETSSCDHFEVSMGSVFELLIEADAVTARCLAHPKPRVYHALDGRVWERPPLIVPGAHESATVRRANRLTLIGYRA